MKVEIHLESASEPIVHVGVSSSYQKGDMYCIRVGDVVYKYPVLKIFRVKEDYQDNR